jgi:mannosyl-oligosaccharide alpha-1,2-mannosidase
MHSWIGYKKYAWLKDEVGPKTGYFKVTFGGWAATLVDSLDSLWIMGEVDEFENAVNALQQIDFTTTEAGTLNLFETTIRYLGGFLGAYDVSGGKYPLLLEKAIQLGDMLLSAFDTPNRMPMTRWDWMRWVIVMRLYYLNY